MDQFNERTDRSAGRSGCHVWIGSHDKDGYGLFSVDGRFRRATRWILGNARGVPLSSNEWALHHCDNPPCVNPEHLYVGNSAQNVADRVRRGRSGKRPKPKHCRNKHEYTPDNVYFETGKRQCLICRKAKLARRYEKEKRLRAAA